MGLALYFLVPMKAIRKMMLLIMKEYMSSSGELKFSSFIALLAGMRCSINFFETRGPVVF